MASNPTTYWVVEFHETYKYDCLITETLPVPYDKARVLMERVDGPVRLRKD